LRNFFISIFILQFAFIHAQDAVFVIKAYQITGNGHTKISVFKRETGKNIGDTVKQPSTTAEVWQKRISGLGLFNLVKVNLKNDTVFIEVLERIYNWGMPRLEWADRNFNVWWQTKDPGRLIYGGTIYFNNLSGLNQKLAITIISGYNHQYEIAYSFPFGYYSKGWAHSARAAYFTNHELWFNTENNKLQFLQIDKKRIQKNYYFSLTQKKRMNYFYRFEITEGWNYNQIDSLAWKSNPHYLLKGNEQNEFYLNTEYISDHRDQRDYPGNGYLLRAGIKFAYLHSADSQKFIPTLQLRFTGFKPLAKKLVLAGAFGLRYTPGTLPYNLSRQLGYMSDYVRGYEPYVSDGSGFVLAKLGLRYALLNNYIVNLGNKKPLKNYKKVPFAVWLNIFADAGKVLHPTLMASNNLNQVWQTGIGAGIDFIAWYSALLRAEYSFNALGTGFFNIAFKNAF
jgi:outer membrane protein assembly factor BamA